MTIFLITFFFMAFVISAMAIGVILGRSPIKGSCGGMGAVGIDTACEICGGNTKKCEDSRDETRQGNALDSLVYDATKKH